MRKHTSDESRSESEEQAQIVGEFPAKRRKDDDPPVLDKHNIPRVKIVRTPDDTDCQGMAVKFCLRLLAEF
jgi:hypothetical protein